MSEMDIYQLPKDQLFWTKEELENEIFKLKNRMKHLKNSEKVQETKEQIVFLINSIKRIENRMNALYM